jgi:hypothetical protein
MERDKSLWPEVKQEVRSTLNLAELFAVPMTRAKVKIMIRLLSTREARRQEANERTGEGVRRFFNSLSPEDREAYTRLRVEDGKKARQRRKEYQTTSAEGGGFTRSFHCGETGRMLGIKPATRFERMK